MIAAGHSLGLHTHVHNCTPAGWLPRPPAVLLITTSPVPPIFHQLPELNPSSNWVIPFLTKAPSTSCISCSSALCILCQHSLQPSTSFHFWGSLHRLSSV